jgi:glycosyltransferase involved in cell wall biosynthesis
MKIVVIGEKLLRRDHNGRYWTDSALDATYYHQLYLRVFDQVKVVAKVEEAQPLREWRRVDDELVSVCPFPNFVGPRGFAHMLPSVLWTASRAVGPHDAVILRGGGVLSLSLESHLRAARHPFGLEVTGDPRDIFAPGSADHRLGWFFRWWFSHELTRLAASASAIAYVTAKRLQQGYPPNADAFVTHYSRVSLPDVAFASGPRHHGAVKSPYRLVAVGAMARPYKGHDVLIHALRHCIDRGVDLTLTLVGDGKHRAELESLAASLSVKDRVTFTGELAGPQAVRQVLAGSDLFVHPSKAEGLPRAVIEAMAQALPCVATVVGGTPELLPPEDLVEPGDASALAEKIRTVVCEPSRMDQMSRQNLLKARDYCDRELHPRRDAFYQHVRERTEEFLGHALHAACQ